MREIIPPPPSPPPPSSSYPRHNRVAFFVTGVDSHGREFLNNYTTIELRSNGMKRYDRLLSRSLDIHRGDISGGYILRFYNRAMINNCGAIVKVH